MQPTTEQVFCSVHMPPAGTTARMLFQHMLLGHLGWLLLVLIVLVLGRMIYGGELLWFSGIGLCLVFALANMLVWFRLHSRVVQVVVSGPALTAHTLYDLYFAPAVPRPFPLAYVNLQLGSGTLSLHYHDRVISLQRHEWPAVADLVQAIQAWPA